MRGHSSRVATQQQTANCSRRPIADGSIAGLIADGSIDGLNAESIDDPIADDSNDGRNAGASIAGDGSNADGSHGAGRVSDYSGELGAHARDVGAFSAGDALSTRHAPGFPGHLAPIVASDRRWAS